MEIKPPEQTGLFEALYTTRALRRFKPDPVPDEVLFQVIDAAIRAPAGGNQQVWHFLIIRDPELRLKVAKWYEDGWNNSGYREVETDPARLAALPRQQQLVVRSAAYLAHNMQEAPVLVFVCGPRNAGGSIYPAVQNFLLACRGMGLGSTLTTLFMRNFDKIAQELGIPEGQQAFALLPVGYPRDKFGPVSRRPVWKHASLDRWGNEWPFAKAQPDQGWRDKWVAPAQEG
ncbi:MAG TPA: nitroreductase family protein [Dehalococcoidia bacterium]|nr:nitroreductase family protein [Dehalococcoidia bacterium]